MDKQLTSVVAENLVDFYFYRRRDKRCVEIFPFSREQWKIFGRSEEDS